MKLAEEDVEHRLLLMSGLMYAGHRIGMWCFSEKKKFFYSTSPHSEKIRLFLKISGILDHLIASDSENPYPVVYTDQVGLIWIGERVNLRGGGATFVFCGPAFHRKNTKNEILMKFSGNSEGYGTRWDSPV